MVLLLTQWIATGYDICRWIATGYERMRKKANMTGYSKDRQLGRREDGRGASAPSETNWELPSELVEDDAPSSPLLPAVRATAPRTRAITTPLEPPQTPERAQSDQGSAKEPPPAMAENTQDLQNTQQKLPKDRRKALPETKHYLVRDLPLATWREYEQIAREHHRSVNYIILRALEAALHASESELS